MADSPVPETSGDSRRARRPATLSAAGLLVWLLAAGAVGVLGSLLLEGARVAAPLRLPPALAMIVAVEVALYLLALCATGGPWLSGLRALGGLLLGLLFRAAQALLLAVAVSSPLAEGGGLGIRFTLYYARLWPAALVQVIAVAVFLWVIRDQLAGPEPEPKPRSVAPPGNAQTREERRELLSALLEPSPVATPPAQPVVGETPVAPVVAVDAPTPEPPGGPPATLGPAPGPAPDDTAALPVTPGPPEGPLTLPLAPSEDRDRE